MPENIDFQTFLEVRISDINYGGHLGNDTILTFAHEARLQFLKSHGYTELNIEGTGLIMADAAIVFKSEAFLGDQLKVAVTIDDISGIGFDIYYKFTNTKDGKEVAQVKTGMVFFNYDLRKIENTPKAFINKITN
jgi:acyl-CoA thioesterase FadM